MASKQEDQAKIYQIRTFSDSRLSVDLVVKIR